MLTRRLISEITDIPAAVLVLTRVTQGNFRHLGTFVTNASLRGPHGYPGFPHIIPRYSAGVHCATGSPPPLLRRRVALCLLRRCGPLQLTGRPVNAIYTRRRLPRRAAHARPRTPLWLHRAAAVAAATGALMLRRGAS